MKLVLITGGGRGIGRAVAVHLLQQGYLLSVCSRTSTDLLSLQQESKNRIRVSQVDVCDETSLSDWIVSECSRESVQPWGLITAAGVHGPIGPLRSASWKEWKRGVEINLFGSVFASKCFAQILLERKAEGRILFFSGGGATRAIENLSSYCASKAAIVRFAETLAHELRPFSITVNAIAPGAVNTALTQTIVDAGPEAAGKSLFETVCKQLQDASHGPEKAVALIEYLLEETSGTITGRLLSAVWDDWPALHKQEALLSDMDLFTLRRVSVPQGVQ